MDYSADLFQCVFAELFPRARCVLFPSMLLSLRHPSCLLAALAVLLGASSCRSLPKFAEPHGEEMDPEAMEGRDRIFYRKLTVDDFRAKAPPDGMQEYAARMGAVTCAHVFTHPDPVYAVSQTESGFEGRYEGLNFVAMMDRECSWWNPEPGQVPSDYVLEHEQIHFALAESAARELDREAQKLISRLHPKGSTAEQVEEDLQAPVRELMEKHMKRLLKRNLDFDEDTSNKYAPEVQKGWYDEVTRELTP